MVENVICKRYTTIFVCLNYFSKYNSQQHAFYNNYITILFSFKNENRKICQKIVVGRAERREIRFVPGTFLSFFFLIFFKIPPATRIIIN